MAVSDGTRGFAVVDLETTGLHPDYHHRMVEIAIVCLDPSGRQQSEWATLLNPERDLGPTHLHGVRPSDVVDAPRFAEVAGEVVAHIAGRVLVAHNLRFDLAFLGSELRRVGADLGVSGGICTLGLASRFGIVGARSLSACCAAFGIDHPTQHEALADAAATSLLLLAYMRLADEAASLTSDCVPVREVPWPDFAPSRACVRRGRRTGAQTPIANFVASLPPGPEQNVVDQEAALEYLAVLDRVLEDRSVSSDELATLAALATEWGLDQQDVHAMHWSYVEGIRRSAWRDGQLTDDERHDLIRVSELLALDPQLSVAATSALDAYQPPSDPLSGLTVCFTAKACAASAVGA